MGACCCCGKRRKGSVDGDSNAPDILYFRSDQEISPQRRQESSRAPICRPEDFSFRINGNNVRQRDVSFRSENLLENQNRLCESMNLNSIRSVETEQAISRKPRPMSEPFDHDVLATKLSSEDKIFKAQKNMRLDVTLEEENESYSETNTLLVEQHPRRKRRGSLEPILFEDGMGSPTEVWLGAQFPDSESNDTDASSCDNVSESGDKYHVANILNNNDTITAHMSHNNHASGMMKSNGNALNYGTHVIHREDDNKVVEEINETEASNLHSTAIASASSHEVDLNLPEDVLCLQIGKDKTRKAHLRKPALVCVGCVEDPLSKARHLLTESMKLGLIDYETCAQLLEGQILSGGILHSFNKTAGFQLLSVDDAMHEGIIEPKMFQRLLAFEQIVDEIHLTKSFNIYQSPTQLSKRMLDLQSDLGGLFNLERSSLIPLIQCVNGGAITKAQFSEIINRQIASGGLVQAKPLRRINLEFAENIGLIESDDVIRMLAFQTLFNGIRDPQTQEPTTYAMCVRRGLLSCNDVIEFLTLQAITHGGWVRNCFTHEWLPITRAMHEGVIDVAMWESVVNTIQRSGKIDTLIHPLWLRPVSYFDLLKSAAPEGNNPSEKVLVVQAGDVYQGVYDPRHHERIDICEALNRDLTDKHTARRLLKAQLQSGGLVDISRRERLSLNEALSRKVVNFPMAVSLVLQQKEGDSPMQTPEALEENIVTQMEESGSLEDLIMKDIVKPKDMMELLQADGYFKGIFDMKTGKNMDISYAHRKGLITKSAVLNVLGTDAQIKGVIDVSTGDTLSVGMATRDGFIDRQTGMRILERQVACGGLLMPPSEVTESCDNEEEQMFAVHDAVKMGIIDPVLGGKLLTTEIARSLSIQTHRTNDYINLPGRDKKFNMQLAIEKIIRDQLCLLGGILDPTNHEIISISEALQRSLITSNMAAAVLHKHFPTHPTTKLFQYDGPEMVTPVATQELSVGNTSKSEYHDSAFVKDMSRQEKQRSSSKKRRSIKYSKPSLRSKRLSTIYEEDETDVINQKTGQEMTPGDLAREAHMEASSGSRVLEGLDPSGRIMIHHSTDTGEIMYELIHSFLHLLSPIFRQESLHITEAYKRGLLTECVAFRLLEAHLAQGGIPDPKTREKLSPYEALKRGYITRELATKLTDALKDLSNERAQVFVFRMNEFICWCCDVESELEACPFGGSQERETLVEEIEKELRKIYTLLADSDAFLLKYGQLIEPDTHDELLFLSDELRTAADSLSSNAISFDDSMTINQPKISMRMGDPQSDRVLNEAVSENLQRVETLNHEAESLESKLKEIPDDFDELPLDEMIKQLEALKKINKGVNNSTPDVESTVYKVDEFLENNSPDADAAKKLDDEKSKLQSRWDVLDAATADKIKQLGEKVSSLQNEQDKQTAATSQMNKLLPQIKEAYKWAKKNHKALQADRPVQVEKEAFENQMDRTKKTNASITEEQENIKEVLEEAKSFAESETIKFVYKDGICDAFKNLVECLEKTRCSLCDVSSKRFKGLESVKPEIEQFNKSNEAFYAWQGSSLERCCHGKQASNKTEELKEELVNISSLNEEIVERNADLRFLEITAQRCADASKSYNGTLPGPVFNPDIKNFWKQLTEEDVLPVTRDSSSSSSSSSSDEDEQSHTNDAIKEVMKKIKTDYDDVKQKAHAREMLLQDALKKRSRYEASMPTVFPWLDDTEKMLDSATSKGIAIEPNALQVTVKDAENMLQDIVSHAEAVNNLKDAGYEVSSLPVDAIADPEREEVKMFCDATEERYEALRVKSSDYAQNLRAALSKSQGLSDHLEGLLNSVDEIEKRLKNNKAETVSDQSKLSDKLNDVKDINNKIKTCEKDVEEAKNSTSELLGSGDQEAVDSLQKRTLLLTDKFNEAKHAALQREDDLDDLHDKAKDFETDAADLLKWMDETMEDLNSDKFNEVNSENIKEVDEALKQIQATTEEKLPIVEKVRSDAETIIGNCHVTDSKPTRETLNKVNNEWDDLQEMLAETDEDLALKRDRLNEYEKLSEDLRGWMHNTDDVINDMKDSIVIETLDKHLDKVQELLDSWEDKSSSLDDLHNLGNLESKSAKSPARRKNRNRRKGRGMRKKRFHSFKDGEQVNGNHKAHLEKGSSSAVDNELDELSSSFDDLYDRLSDKQIVLNDTKQTRNDYDAQETNMDNLLTDAEKIHEKWRKEEDKDIKEKINDHKKWRESFLSHRNDLHSVKATSNKLTEAKPSAEGVPEVEESTENIEERWNKLLKNSEDTLGELESNFGAMGDFNNRAMQLKEWLADKKQMMKMVGPIVCDKNTLNSQLQQVDHLNSDVNAKKKQIDDLEAIAMNLSSTEDIQKDLAQIENNWKDLHETLETRKEETEDTIKQVNDIMELSKNVREWSKATCNKNNEILNKMKAEKDSFKNGKESVKTTEEEYPVYESKCKECQIQIDDLAKHVDASSLKPMEDEVLSTKESFDSAVGSTDTLKDTLKKAEELNNKFLDDAKDLESWIEDTQKSIKDIKPEMSEEKLVEIQEKVKDLQKECKEKIKASEDLKNISEDVCNLCPASKKEITEKVKKISEDIEKLMKDLEQALGDCVNMLQRLHEFENLVDELEQKVDDGELQLTEHKAIPQEGKTERHVEALKILQGDIAAMAPQVVDLSDFMKSEDISDDEELAGKVNDVACRFRDLKRELDEECGKLANTVKETEEFQESLEDVLENINDFEEDFDNWDHIGREVDVLQAQKKQANDIQEKCDKTNAKSNDIEKKYKELAASGDIMDEFGIQREVNGMMRKNNRLSSRVAQRCEELNRISNQVNSFHNTAEKTIKEIKDIVDKEADLGDVPTSVDKILDQQKKFDKTRANNFEPLQSTVQKLHYTGHGLIISAAPDVKTTTIEKVLEDLDVNWNNASTAMNQRGLDLQKALLNCGRFQDVLASLSAWLRDAEQLSDSQKPPSWEYKVLLAQIEEQKVLQKMISSHREAVTSFIKEGKQIAANSCGEEKGHIENQIKQFSDRWDKLNDTVTKRDSQLQSMLVDAKKFSELSDEFAEWLDQTERSQANNDVIGTQVDHIQKQLAEQQVLMADIANHSRMLQDIKETPLTEKTAKYSPSLLAALESKIEALEKRYNALNTHVLGRTNILKDNLNLCQLFNEDQLRLFAFLSEAELKVNEPELSLPDAMPIPIANVLQEHENVLQEVESKRAIVDATVAEGTNLLKKCTGDDTIKVQEKLEGIKGKYNDLLSRCQSRVKTLQNCLKLSKELNSNHNDLNSWLDDVETSLKDLGMDIDDVDSTRKRHLSGDARKMLDDFVQMIHPEEYEPLLKSVKKCSKELMHVSSRWGDQSLHSVMSGDEERYNSLVNALNQHKQSQSAMKQKLNQFLDHADKCDKDLDKLSDDLEAFSKLQSLDNETISEKKIQQETVAQSLATNKNQVDSVGKEGRELIPNCDTDDSKTIETKVCDLEDKLKRNLVKNNASPINRTIYLASSYLETKDELVPWIEETKAAVEQFKPFAVVKDELAPQQEQIMNGKANGHSPVTLEELCNEIAEHRPYVDKLNKNSNQIQQLVGNKTPLSDKLRDETAEINKSYAEIKDAARSRSVLLGEAVSQSSHFFENLNGLVETLERIKNKLNVSSGIYAEPDKIKDKIEETKQLEVEVDKLLPAYNSLLSQGDQLLIRAKESGSKASVDVINDKVKGLKASWEDVSSLLQARAIKLLEVLTACQTFWTDADSLNSLIKEVDSTIAQEVGEPAIDVTAVKQQMEVLEALCEEMDNLKTDLEAVNEEAVVLCKQCESEEPGDKPETMEIKRALDELQGSWNELEATVSKTRRNLEEALNAAVEFQENIQKMIDIVQEAIEKINNLDPVATDLEELKEQINELKEIRTETHSHQLEIERLSNHGDHLIGQSKDDEERAALQQSINLMREAWKDLDKALINRQHNLETALLALGQLHHAITEFNAWLKATDNELDSKQAPVNCSPKQIEIEIAKHRIVCNDIAAHKGSLDSVISAGHDLSSQSLDGSSGSPTKRDGIDGQMENLTSKWEDINVKAQARQWELEEALEKAQNFQQGYDSLMRWLQDKEQMLNQSPAYGGLPETAMEQLNDHLLDMEELDDRKQLADEIFNTLDSEGEDVALLKKKLNAVTKKMKDRKEKLEEVLKQAQDFHNSFKDFADWLTHAEKVLDTHPPLSFVLETAKDQVEKQKAFEDDVMMHRDILMNLDKVGSHLKYFSQKQDGILIKNLLLSVHGRWDRVTSRTSELCHVLNDAYKKAQQFDESVNKLLDWIESAGNKLQAEAAPGTDPEKIKELLENHKEFQRALASKRPVCETCVRSGKSLKDKAHSFVDKSKLEDTIKNLKDKWDELCDDSAKRQQDLEQAMMMSGRLNEAIDTLLDWLYRTEPLVAQDAPVHGDWHTVNNLIDRHKALQNDLKNRKNVVKSLEDSTQALLDGAAEGEDVTWIKSQREDLLSRWNNICNLARIKEARLESAKAQADEFNDSTQHLLGWLSEAETNLRLNQKLPDDEFQLHELKAGSLDFASQVPLKEEDLKRIQALGNSILEKAHPDAIGPLKQWMAALQSRWDEVVTWAKQHSDKLDTAISELETNTAIMNELLRWLEQSEANLIEKNATPLPTEIQEIEKLLTEHQQFQDEMHSKQPDYDKVTKNIKRRPNSGDGKRKKSTDILSEDPVSPNSRLPAKWQKVWLMVMDRQQKLQSAKNNAQQIANLDSFSFDKWRSKYMKWMKNKKSRVMDFFRKIDSDGDGKITRQEFIDGIIKSKFPTSLVEMEKVADIFDQDKDGYIDYYEFVGALHPNKEVYKPENDADKIEDEVVRQVAKCTCCKRFQVQQISENKYRFGDNQQLRLVRILRSTVMVRVGGGWMALDEFLLKNDPCRVLVTRKGGRLFLSSANQLPSNLSCDDFFSFSLSCLKKTSVNDVISALTPHNADEHSISDIEISTQINEHKSMIPELASKAQGRTNSELREKFILPAGSSQAMTPFKSKRAATPRSRQSYASPGTSAASSRTTSPSRHSTTCATQRQKYPLRTSTPRSTASTNDRNGSSTTPRSRTDSDASSEKSADSLRSTGRKTHTGVTSTPTGRKPTSKIPTKGVPKARKKI